MCKHFVLPPSIEFTTPSGVGVKTRFGVDFDPTQHSYGKDDQGRTIPSVSKLANPNRGFISTKARIAMSNGTAVHANLEAVMNGVANGERITKKGCADERTHDMAMRWRAKVHLINTIPCSEVRFVCTLTNGDETLHYAGTADVVEVSRSGCPKNVIDWKTGGKSAWHKQQIGLYALAMGLNRGVIIYEKDHDFANMVSAETAIGMVRAYHEKNI